MNGSKSKAEINAKLLSNTILNMFNITTIPKYIIHAIEI